MKTDTRFFAAASPGPPPVSPDTAVADFVQQTFGDLIGTIQRARDSVLRLLAARAIDQELLTQGLAALSRATAAAEEASRWLDAAATPTR